MSSKGLLVAKIQQDYIFFLSLNNKINNQRATHLHNQTFESLCSYCRLFFGQSKYFTCFRHKEVDHFATERVRLLNFLLLNWNQKLPTLIKPIYELILCESRNYEVRA